MIPILHSPGVITPGQFGPISTDCALSFRNALALTMSRTGMHSVIATITSIATSAPSIIESAACLCVFLLAATAMGGQPDALSVEIDKIKQAGEPIELAQFEVRGVADADNAAIELRAVGDAIDKKKPAWLAYDYLNNPQP